MKNLPFLWSFFKGNLWLLAFPHLRNLRYQGGSSHESCFIMLITFRSRRGQRPVGRRHDQHYLILSYLILSYHIIIIINIIIIVVIVIIFVRVLCALHQRSTAWMCKRARTLPQRSMTSLSKRTWTLLPHPTPPQQGQKRQKRQKKQKNSFHTQAARHGASNIHNVQLSHSYIYIYTGWWFQPLWKIY